MQDGWGGGGEDLSLSGGQWDTEEGDMWNSTASQESNSSCNSWGNASKKGPQKVCILGLTFCSKLLLGVVMIISLLHRERSQGSRKMPGS